VPARWRIALGIAAAAALLLCASRLPARGALGAMVAWAATAGPLGPLAFAVAYATAPVLLLPVWPLTLAAGLAYGLGGGVLLAAPASALGATLAFLAGRRLLRRRAARLLASRPRLAVVAEALGAPGLRLVVLLRLSPLLPYSLLNYALGATRLRLRDFAAGSLLGMLPLTLLYAWLGSLLGGAVVGGAAPPPGGRPGLALSALGLVATGAAVALLAHRARRALPRPPAGT
jgi:uncharacterized membrane protein YdjX (TVP38/TMEM64 family)